MMLVEHILDTGKTRLATISSDAGICEAAAVLMNPDTPLVVVCDSGGVALGVISRGDVIKVLASARAEAHMARADQVMSRRLLSCSIQQPLQQVWESMNGRSVRCVPILDADGRPQGVLHARDLATALLEEVTNEELLLRDYVLGIGYQ
jgi:CBS domain-containing protein